MAVGDNVGTENGVSVKVSKCTCLEDVSVGDNVGAEHWVSVKVSVDKGIKVAFFMSSLSKVGMKSGWNSLTMLGSYIISRRFMVAFAPEALLSSGCNLQLDLLFLAVGCLGRAMALIAAEASED